MSNPWGAAMASAFANAVKAGRARAPEEELDAIREQGRYHQEMLLFWHLRFCGWKRWFAWYPVRTDAGRKWLQWVMRSRYVNAGYVIDKIYLSVPTYVGYRLEGKVGEPRHD